ncbi:pentatricopeptide repeat-containing protein At2g27800, mitochondrial isoform X1 [Nicotiana tomentosiformis]|uniref:pentatricopeptide repeat-containing protein At2g27800, mitochondrial isoform X1 n=2 Tax=Nicotiana tomentosiformis TaxID=4098 RepID=UPI00051C6518|nr:pentatricopeptide repeat-containing protein At2g27800, mitochondrial isoform X1 [Nicotiana tomentosiformis]
MLFIFRHYFAHSCSKLSLFCIKDPTFNKITCLNILYYHSYVYPFSYSSRKLCSWPQIYYPSNPRPLLAQTQFVNFYCSSAPTWLRGPPSRSLRKRMNRRARAASKPVLDESRFQRAVTQLPPRFTPEELRDVMTSENDPLVCLELFNWASKQHRFRHDVSTYHIAIQRLGEAKMYEEMDHIVNQVLAVPSIGSEALFNSMIYYFTEARKLTRAVMIYKHMLNSRKLDCRPSIKTYNILFAALLSRRNNSYINHMYMDTIRSLFKQMVDNGIEPDIFSLNTMIKGYVLSLHVNDALRVFHQMGVVYQCQPNSFSYDYLIHGLCAQGRTKNAKEIYDKMKCKAFIPSSKSYNSLVNSLALGGEVDEAVKFMWEMNENRRTIDFITFRTVIDEVCRQTSVKDAIGLLKELQNKDIIDGLTHSKLLCELEDDVHNLNVRNRYRFHAAWTLIYVGVAKKYLVFHGNER